MLSECSLGPSMCSVSAPLPCPLKSWPGLYTHAGWKSVFLRLPCDQSMIRRCLALF